MKKERPPIVVVLGHVDHGKTTLLDKIRGSSVQAREAGGITQGIGASTVKTKEGKSITFLDTPGHAAFSGMRERGAKVADLAILVVAADAGVAPQTKEAISYINDVGIPMVVALTKVDLATANVESVVGQLEKEGVFFEGRGGNTAKVEVSGKTGAGVEDLMELVGLTAEVNGVSGDAEGKFRATVIETGKDRRGPHVSVVVKDGILKVGQEVQSGALKARIRGLFDENGKSVKEVKPGYPALVLGFSDLPAVGEEISGAGEASEIKDGSKEKTHSVKDGEYLVLLKAENAGALEALEGAMPDGVGVVGAGVGEVSPADIFQAKSSGAVVMAYRTGVPGKTKKLAEMEGVKIMVGEVIYDLCDELEKVLEEGKEEILGKAEILAEFPYNKKRVAGCKVISGKISRGLGLRLVRGEEELGSVKIVSLKKQKEEVNEVKEGEEFGVLFSPNLDFEIGDVLISAK